ncbi:MAG TPA: IS1634 family transposase [Segetibacter sp.]
MVSVQVIDKSSGKYKLAKTIGSSSNLGELEQLYQQAVAWIRIHTGALELDFQNERQIFEQFTDGIQSIDVVGPELLLGSIFDQIGFNAISEVVFRQLVITRLCYPVSKLKTIDYLEKYNSISLDIDNVYRYLDKLYNTQKEQVQQISYAHTLKILNNRISIVFYDVTTLYFEAQQEDELRKTGFSKDGKHQHPQIVLGLLVSIGGYPLVYDIFEGNKFEGHTMLPVVEGFKLKYKLTKLVVVADSGLMSAANVDELQSKGYEYILGARIKNEKQNIQEKILALSLKNGESSIVQKDTYSKIIISYSDKRAAKDKHNRQRGLQKLEKQIRSGKLTKAHINNRGYNKYLKLEGKVKISIDNTKIEDAGKWDGLKGYITNTDLTKDEIIENYGHLWRIEKAFRISKTDLQIRPIYHRLKHRIEAHICIAFVAYKIYKELERQLKEKQSALSPEKAIQIAKTIYAIKIATPLNKNIITKTLILTQDQKDLKDLFKWK